MNALEKYAAKRHLINLLIEKLANPAPGGVRQRANSMFGEMNRMRMQQPTTTSLTKTTTSKAPAGAKNTAAMPRPTTPATPAAPRKAAPAAPTGATVPRLSQPLAGRPKPPRPMQGPSTTKPMPSPAPKPSTNRPARTTVMQGSTGANVQGGFKFDRGAAMKSYQPGKYSKNPHMDRTIHMNRARRDALRAYQAKQSK